jgi:ArsR family transcriptional regulator
MSALTTVRELKAHYLGLANPTRLEIVSLLAKREMAGSELARKLKLSQPLLSWHLRIMRKAGLIDTRRHGREVFCSLDRVGIRHYQDRFNQLIKATGPTAAGPEFVPVLPEKEIANAV